MKYTILFLVIMFLLPSVNAETTFFDQDDTFIMGSSTSSGTDSETTGGGSCLTNWTCSDWGFCNNGIQIRNCTKEKAYCYADLNKKPIESQNCFIDKSEDKKRTALAISLMEGFFSKGNPLLYTLNLFTSSNKC